MATPSERIEHSDFSLILPEGWVCKSENERRYGVCLSPPGVLCCTPERVTETDRLPNLARMLAGFLTRQGHPVATDELLIVSGVAGADGYSWQYVEDGSFLRFWIFGNETRWLFLTFTTPEAHRIEFLPVLDELIRTLRVKHSDDTQGSEESR